jgi:hypothetical protein
MKAGGKQSSAEDGGDVPPKRRLTFNGLQWRYIPEDSIRVIIDFNI